MDRKKRKIRVLHIITHLPIGGAQDNTLLTVERHDRTKYEVALLCNPEGEWMERARKIPNLNLIFVDELIRRINFKKDWTAFQKIYRIIKKGNYDIVHTHSSKPGFHGRLAAKLARTPIIIHTMHGFSFNDYMRPIARRLFLNIERLLSLLTDRIITVSKLNLEKIVRLRLAPRKKLVNIYSGIDFSRFRDKPDTEAKKRELGILNGEQIVGMVGRFSPQKAPLDLVHAIPRVLKTTKDVRFLFVGDGDLRSAMLKKAAELGVESRVTLLGFRDDVPELLHLLDVFVLPSLWEGLGRSLTEAMYAGVPIVATRVEGVPELVDHGRTGILVQPRDINAIADGISELLSDRKKAKQLGDAAKKRITKVFDADVMVREIERIYEELLSAKNKP